ncbi:TPA: hypothetical protein DCZ17_00380 [Candidatus Collierbacteria bacterium]|nr:hypothetical protein [Candidatus Collierbacteria bacterium]
MQSTLHGPVFCFAVILGSLHFDNISIMYYTYVLQSQVNGKLYVGYSSNLRRRLQEHKQKKVHTTYRMKNVELIHYEAYKSQTDARRREKYLKTTQGKRMLKIMLADSLKISDYVSEQNSIHSKGPIV